MADFSLKTGDLVPSITATLIDADGAAIDIAGADVTFVLRKIDADAPTIESAATNLQVTDGTDGSKGHVRYDFIDGDTDDAGGYRGEWRVEFAEGPGTMPNSRYVSVAIYDSLGGGS